MGLLSLQGMTHGLRTPTPHPQLHTIPINFGPLGHSAHSGLSLALNEEDNNSILSMLSVRSAEDLGFHQAVGTDPPAK